jgi:hypothetical protein
MATPVTDPYASIATPLPATAGTAASDPYASIATPLPAATSAKDPNWNNPAWAPKPPVPVDPPKDHKEELVKSLSGDAGLSVYRHAREAVGGVEMMLKAPTEAYEVTKQALVDKLKSLPSDIASNVMPETDPDITHHQMYAQPIFRGPGVGQAAEAFGADAASAAKATPVAAATTPTRVNPFREILKGKSIAQAPAESAVRGGVAAGVTEPSVAAGIATNPILEGSKTVLDEPLSSLATKEKAAYKAVDDAAGFDVKEAKLGLKNDQYNLKQLGNTEADKATRTKLQAAIADSTKRISDAEAKLSAAGIDPKAADVLHTSRMAGQDFKNILVRNTAPDGTINVDSLLKQSKMLRFSKRGDRLMQFMGKDAADQYMTQLEAAQKAGMHAMKVQKLAKWVGGLAATGLGIGAGVHAATGLLALGE